MEPTMRQPQRTGWLARNWGCLVPIGLICAVVFYIVAIWNPRSPEEASKQDTLNRQTRLIHAIEAYCKATGTEPDDGVDSGGFPGKQGLALQMASLVTTLQGKDANAAVREATKAILGKDPQSLTHDAYGNAMLYVKDKGVGGNPVIISAGADGVFGYEKNLSPEQQQRYKMDNIRSDTSN